MNFLVLTLEECWVDQADTKRWKKPSENDVSAHTHTHHDSLERTIPIF